jgi:hypothetical protein
MNADMNPFGGVHGEYKGARQGFRRLLRQEALPVSMKRSKISRCLQRSVLAAAVIYKGFFVKQRD